MILVPSPNRDLGQRLGLVEPDEKGAESMQLNVLGAGEIDHARIGKMRQDDQELARGGTIECSFDRDDAQTRWKPRHRCRHNRACIHI